MEGSERLVLVCQHRSCQRCGSAQVLADLQNQAPQGITVEGMGCLGLCGSGPIVLVLPEQVYYWRVQSYAVPVLVRSHLLENQIVSSMLHPRLHRIS